PIPPARSRSRLPSASSSTAPSARSTASGVSFAAPRGVAASRRATSSRLRGPGTSVTSRIAGSASASLSRAIALPPDVRSSIAGSGMMECTHQCEESEMSIAERAGHDRDRWHSAAAAVQARAATGLFIDGRFVDARKGGRFETRNPANGELLALVAEGTEADVDAAVAAARRAFRGGSWSRLAPRARMEVLYRLARLVEERAEELAVLDSLD